ncbi:MAG: hypothetical protein RLZZ387_1251 [Chloroflexota bacterium]|jgi:ParB/RepB/Spo0J family partition protein
MSAKADKLKELRERAAAMMTRPAPGAADAPPAPEAALPAPETPSPEGPSATELQAHFGIAALDQVAAGRAVQRLPVGHIAPDLRPEARQPRLLPLPEELLVGGQPAPGYADLVESLRELGRSLAERQIQPILVYPGASDRYPAARYRILVGHRRWTAACLAGLPQIDAVVVEPPTDADRIRLQYAENEERTDFSDMERVWALQQLKQALGDAPWEAVEERIQMSRGRRQELLRLTAFTASQQVDIARLRLRETQLRPLHTAIRSGELTGAQAEQVLAQLVKVARPLAAQGEGERGSTLDGPTIARAVARAKRAAVAAQPTPQWVPGLRDQLDRAEKGLTRARRRFGELGDADAGQIAAQLRALAARLAEAASELERREPGTPEDEDT